MRSIMKLAFAGAASLSFFTTANATVITFGGLASPNGTAFTGPYTEAGFDVTALSGDLFVGQFAGNDLPSLFVSSIDPNVSNSGALQIVRSGGGNFSFTSFDLLGNNGLADYIVTGFLGASSVFSFAGNQGSPFSTIAGSAGSIDRLVFNLTANGTSLNVDNISVDPEVDSAVPEPANWMLMLAGFGLLGSALRRQPVQVRVKYT